jgi:hypothetical protein
VAVIRVRERNGLAVDSFVCVERAQVGRCLGTAPKDPDTGDGEYRENENSVHRQERNEDGTG